MGTRRIDVISDCMDAGRGRSATLANTPEQNKQYMAQTAHLTSFT